MIGGSYQSLVAGQQPPIIAHQPAATSHWLQTTSYQSLVAYQQPPITAYQPAFTSCSWLVAASHKLQVIGGGAAHGLGVVAAGGGGRPAG